MYVIGNSVQSFSHTVSSLFVGWCIGNGKEHADELFTCKMISNIEVLFRRSLLTC